MSRRISGRSCSAGSATVRGHASTALGDAVRDSGRLGPQRDRGAAVDPWPSIAAWVRAHTGAALAERAELLGVAAAPVRRADGARTTRCQLGRAAASAGRPGLRPATRPGRSLGPSPRSGGRRSTDRQFEPLISHPPMLPPLGWRANDKTSTPQLRLMAVLPGMWSGCFPAHESTATGRAPAGAAMGCRPDLAVPAAQPGR